MISLSELVNIIYPDDPKGYPKVKISIEIAIGPSERYASDLLHLMPSIVGLPDLTGGQARDIIRIASLFHFSSYFESLVARREFEWANEAVKILNYLHELTVLNNLPRKDVRKILDSAMWWLITSISNYSIKTEKANDIRNS